jgi:hypothetical protein
MYKPWTHRQRRNEQERAIESKREQERARESKGEQGRARETLEKARESKRDARGVPLGSRSVSARLRDRSPTKACVSKI